MTALERELLATLKTVRDQLGEAIHTGLRKGADGGGSDEAWRAIRDMSDKQWSNAVQFALCGLGVTRAIAKAERVEPTEGGNG